MKSPSTRLPSFFEADQYDNEWQTNPSAMAQIVRGGIDLFAISPTIPVDGSIGVTLSLIGNMPIPSADGDFIQITRDAVDAILDEAEHLAQFKEGGAEFTDSIQLHQRFLSVAMKTNSRLAESGIFPTDLRRTISKEDEAVPRFAPLQENPRNDQLSSHTRLRRTHSPDRRRLTPCLRFLPHHIQDNAGG